jgi:hypothetical protein
MSRASKHYAEGMKNIALAAAVLTVSSAFAAPVRAQEWGIPSDLWQSGIARTQAVNWLDVEHNVPALQAMARAVGAPSVDAQVRAIYAGTPDDRAFGDSYLYRRARLQQRIAASIAGLRRVRAQVDRVQSLDDSRAVRQAARAEGLAACAVLHDAAFYAALPGRALDMNYQQEHAPAVRAMERIAQTEDYAAAFAGFRHDTGRD